MHPQTVYVDRVVAGAVSRPGPEEPKAPGRWKRVKRSRQGVGKKELVPRGGGSQGDWRKLEGSSLFPFQASAHYNSQLSGPLEYQPHAHRDRGFGGE